MEKTWKYKLGEKIKYKQWYSVPKVFEEGFIIINQGMTYKLTKKGEKIIDNFSYILEDVEGKKYYFLEDELEKI